MTLRMAVCGISRVVAGRGDDRLGQRPAARRPSGGGRSAVAAAGSAGGAAGLARLDVGLDDAAVRARALELREIERPSRRDALGERRGEDAVAARRGCRLRRRGLAAALAAGCGCWAAAGSSRPARTCRRLRPCGGGAAAARRGAGRATSVSPSSSRTAIDGVDLHALGALGHDDLADLALVDGLDLHGGLVGLDLGDHLAGLDRVAFLYCHLASLPSVMVGDSAGIRMLIGMAVAPSLSD